MLQAVNCILSIRGRKLLDHNSHKRVNCLNIQLVIGCSKGLFFSLLYCQSASQVTPGEGYTSSRFSLLQSTSDYMVYFLDKSNDIILGSRYEAILDVKEIMSEMSTTKS